MYPRVVQDALGKAADWVADNHEELTTSFVMLLVAVAMLATAFHKITGRWV
jgi:hypothetical protein